MRNWERHLKKLRRRSGNCEHVNIRMEACERRDNSPPIAIVPIRELLRDLKRSLSERPCNGKDSQHAFRGPWSGPGVQEPVDMHAAGERERMTHVLAVERHAELGG